MALISSLRTDDGDEMLVADLLCGAGGSSTGCAQALAALGLKMRLKCLNHWPVAIDTHTRNHPEAEHYCQDIATVRPHRVVPEGYLDLLMASPSCVYHSNARGGKPTSDQQRSDPWHIITWLTELYVKRLIIENVWEFINWGPVDPRTGRPIPERRGEYFRAWIDTITRLGFVPEWRKLNAADYGEATTRQRFILMARNDSRRIIWPKPTHGAGCSQPWRPASEIIDWRIKGKSIFTRKKKLAHNTLERILDGALRTNWPDPFLVILRNHMAGKSIRGPLPAIAAGGNHIGLAQPILLATGRGRARTTKKPLPTITTGGAGTRQRTGCARPMLVEPIIFNGRKNNKAKGVTAAPVPALDTKGGLWLAEPFVLSQASGGAARPVSRPIPTAATAGAIALISPYYGSGSGDTCRPVSQPLPTATAKGRFGLVVPITHHGKRRSRDPKKEPLPTLTTAHRGELALVEGVDGYDILFRMLEPHELAAAMGFSSGEIPYEFAGTKTEQVKQVGNAVPVRLMRACVSEIMADAAPRRVSKMAASA